MSLFCFADHRRRVSLNNNGDIMNSLPLGIDHSGGLYAAGFGDGGHGHDDDLSQLVGASTSSVLLPKEATEKTKGAGAGNKAATALKNHSEAERRRRERINAHLATLRGMVPCTDKMDKAALLAEVIAHVKKLKANAARISGHCPVPADADEVTVEMVHQDAAASSSSCSSAHGNGAGGGGGLLVKATLSCDDGVDLFADVKDALRPLRLKVVGSDVTTLGGRVRFTFLLLASSPSPAACSVVEPVRQALQSVLEKTASALDFAPRTSLLHKRRRVSTFDSSSSSS